MLATTGSVPLGSPPAASVRDLRIDALRSSAVGVVVVGHAIVAAVAWRDGRPVADNLLATSPVARALTWAFQVLPLVFLCGGFAAARSAGRPGWLAGRIERLAAPVTAYLAVAAGSLAAARLTGVLDDRSVEVVGRALVMHLWFLGALVVVLALVPALVAAGRGFGWRAVPVAVAGAAVVDLAARPFPLAGWLNVALVWGLCAYLGVLRALGLGWPGGRRGAALSAVACLAGLLALVAWGGYPASMVGVPGAGRSNAGPPSLAMALLGLVQAGAFTALSVGWEPRRTSLVTASNRLAMGAYLWQFAGIVLAAVVLLPTGLLPAPPTGTWAWWAWRPVWVAACLVAVAAVVATVGRRATGRPAPGTPGPWATAVAVGCAAAGFVLVTTSGVTPSWGFVGGAGCLAAARAASRSSGPAPSLSSALGGPGLVWRRRRPLGRRRDAGRCDPATSTDRRDER